MSHTLEQLLEIVTTIIESSEFCFFITVDQSGQPAARLMQPFEPEEDLTIWFGASPRSRKAQEIQRDQRVTLGYENPSEGAYVTLIGYASVEYDRALRQSYWRDKFADFWPEGPDSDDYALIKFTPTRIEAMNIAEQVAPEPFGLRPVTLVRVGLNWMVSADSTTSY